jgi:hypothetical protein
MDRREYLTNITLNGRKIWSVIIDSHYEVKHSESIDDEIILRLVLLLNGKEADPDDQQNNFTYYSTDKMLLNNRLYKLVWLLEKQQNYIGIINAFRRD